MGHLGAGHTTLAQLLPPATTVRGGLQLTLDAIWLPEREADRQVAQTADAPSANRPLLPRALGGRGLMPASLSEQPVGVDVSDAAEVLIQDVLEQAVVGRSACKQRHR